nr:EOG090X0F8Y [Lepidurus arcticus]
MALNDLDVQKQIKQMMGFIEQEANEKVEEIDAKAEEEFNIEKGRLVQQQRLKIMEFFERKEKQVELQKKIQSSNMLNAARLQVLKAQEEHVKRVLEEAKSRLVQVTSNQQKYGEILRALIIQALFRLMETNVIVRCRAADVDLLRSLLPGCVVAYQEATKKNVNVSLDPENFLPPHSFGGVELLALRGKIKVTNTLESRLDLIAQQILPEVRNMLFGNNMNRKFFD